jgi:hypothetical protein
MRRARGEKGWEAKQVHVVSEECARRMQEDIVDGGGGGE